MATSVSNKNKMYLTTAGVLAFGVAAYGLGRIYPPLGPTAGTIAPAQRYVSSQVGEGDVTLGDTAVPELMQTDAFQVMVKDPNFRALANDPGFAALASIRPRCRRSQPIRARLQRWQRTRRRSRRCFTRRRSSPQHHKLPQPRRQL